jgi:hypothetical protein
MEHLAWILGTVVHTSRGDDGVPYRNVPLSIVVTIIVFLVSAIGAQQTVIWTAQHERQILARTVSLDTDAKIDRAIASDRAVTALHFATLDVEVRELRDRMDAAQRQIAINTGKLEQGGAWRSR